MILLTKCVHCDKWNDSSCGFYRGSDQKTVHWICAFCNEENEIKSE
jgi:hypothetical protein